MHHRSTVPALFGLGVLLGTWALGLRALPGVAQAATLTPLEFNDMVQRAAVIVQGRVSKLESFWGSGRALAKRQGVQAVRSPARRPALVVPAPGIPPEPPISADVEGGRIIMTRVTLDVLSPLQGVVGQELEFVIAGGAIDDQNVVIPGMPEFTVGRLYIVFLRQAPRLHADPIVGVNQGFFQIVRELASGEEVVLNADADYVLGVENNRVVTRHNPRKPGRALPPAMQLTGPPVPDDPNVRSRTSAAVERYWHSTEPPMTVGDFVQTIRAHRQY